MKNEFSDWQGGDEQQHGNVLAIVHRLLRGRYLLTFSMAAVLAIAGAVWGYMSYEPMYQSRATIHVRPRVERVMYENEQNTSSREFAGLVSTQHELIRSNRVLSLALSSDRVRALQAVSGLYRPEQISADLSVRTSRQQAEIINVVYEHVNREVAKAVVESVIDAYMELYGNQANKINSPEIVNTLQSKRGELEKERDGINRQIRELTNEWSTDNLSLLVRNAIAKVHQLEAQQIDLQSQVGQLENFANAAEDGSFKDELTPERAAQIDDMMAALLARRLSLEDAKADLEAAGFRSGHPDMRLVLSAIENVNQRIDKRLGELRDGVAQIAGVGPNGVGGTLDQLKFQISSINERLEAARKEQQRLGSADLDMQDLVSRRESVNEKIAEVDERLDEIHTESKIMDFDNAQRISVVEKGVTPVEPSSDRRRKMAAMGFVGGGALPVAAMLALGFFSRSVRFSDDQILAGGTGIVGMLPDLGNSLGDQELAEASAFAVHQIRSQLQILHGKGERGVVYEVTSPSSQDGKTSLIIAMGLSFAESGEKTLLLDLDLIGRGLSIHFGYPNAPSLVDAMMTPERLTEMVQTTDFESLSLLPAGFGDDAEISRLSPVVIRRLIEALRAKYDVVLVDTGPILGSIEAGFLAAEADGVIVVVGRGQMRQLIRRAFDQINAVGGKIVATVFNRASGYELRQSTGTMSVHFSRQAARQAAEAAARSGPRVGPVAGTLFADRIKQNNDSNKAG